MSSLIFEIPIAIGAIEFSRIVLLDPLVKVSFPYFKTTNKSEGHLNVIKYAAAVTLYYLLVSNLTLLPIYSLKTIIGTIIGTIIVGFILCKLTPLWEILTTSFKLTAVKSTSSTKDVIVGDLMSFNHNQRNEMMIRNSERRQLLQLGILLSNDNKFSIPKKNNNKFNQNVQQNFQHDAIIMNASVLAKLTRLLSIIPQTSSHHTYRKRSKNVKSLTRVNEKVISTLRQSNNLLICDSQQSKDLLEKQVSTDTIEQVYVAPPGVLFLSEEINKLEKEIVDLTEHENLTRELIKQKEQNDQIDEEYELTKKIHQDLIGQIKHIDSQKQQYQVQVQENIVSKDVIRLSIPAFTIKQENSKEFAVYVIMVQRIDASTGQAKAGWIIPRRYNEFSLLNQHLRNHYISSVKGYEFPGKTLFNLLDNSFLESRRIQLENFLQGVLTKDEVCKDNQFLKFLSKEN